LYLHLTIDLKPLCGAHPQDLVTLLSHLTAPTRELAFQDAKARIRLVQTARWVGYPRAGVAVEELKRRFNYPTCARMPCMLLYGDSGIGKSTI
jgi:putative ribosome biogenesis GTPase RsgA